MCQSPQQFQLRPAALITAPPKPSLIRRKHRNAPGPVKATISATPVRNADGRWRIPRADVEIQLAENNADYRDLERVIAQFEEFCVVTQSVRDGIDIEVTVRDGHGHVLLGDKSFEAGA